MKQRRVLEGVGSCMCNNGRVTVPKPSNERMLDG